MLESDHKCQNSLRNFLLLCGVIEILKCLLSGIVNCCGCVIGVLITIICSPLIWLCFCCSSVMMGCVCLTCGTITEVFFFIFYSVLDFIPGVGVVVHLAFCFTCHFIVPVQTFAKLACGCGIFLMVTSPFFAPICAPILLPLLLCIGCPILLCPNIAFFLFLNDKRKGTKIVPISNDDEEEELILIDNPLEESDEGKPLEDLQSWGLIPRYDFNKNETEPMRSPAFNDHPALREGDPFPGPVNGIGTLTGNMIASCEKYGDKILYRWRDVTSIETTQKNDRTLITREHGEVQTMSFRQAWDQIIALASGLAKFCSELKDEEEKEQARIGIYLDTCKEWVFAEHAILLQRGVVVTVYANLGFEALIKCVNESELETIVCDESSLQRIDENFPENCPTVKRLISVKTNHGFDGSNSTYTPQNYECKPIYDLISENIETFKKIEEYQLPVPEDLALIMYTSGTTGDPKGVMISHENICVGIESVRLHTNVNCSDIHFSYLPLAHILEQTLHQIVLFLGGEVCLGHPRSLVAKEGGAKNIGDLALFRPTVLVGVPRVYDTIRKGVLAKLRKAGGAKEKLFLKVLNKQIKILKETYRRDITVTGSSLLFKKVRSMTGGRTRYMVSAGAALSSDTQLFLQAVMGPKTHVFQVYGMTENGCLTCQRLSPYTMKTSRVGVIMCSCEMKLSSVPDMGYIANPKPIQSRSDSGAGAGASKTAITYPLRQGEIFVRGPTITKGYYRKPEKTAEVYLEDGWFRTGDIGMRNLDGTISIVDRVKNLVKLSCGEYVALEHLEAMYGTSSFVTPNGICITEGADHLVAVVCVDHSFVTNYYEKVFKHANKENIIDNFTDILKLGEIKGAMMEDFGRIHKEKEMQGWEKLLDLWITNDEWTPENNMLTASSKLKRREIKKRYKEEITGLFNGGTRNVTEEVEGEGESDNDDE